METSRPSLAWTLTSWCKSSKRSMDTARGRSRAGLRLVDAPASLHRHRGSSRVPRQGASHCELAACQALQVPYGELHPLIVEAQECAKVSTASHSVQWHGLVPFALAFADRGLTLTRGARQAVVALSPAADEVGFDPVAAAEVFHMAGDICQLLGQLSVRGPLHVFTAGLCHALLQALLVWRPCCTFPASRRRARYRDQHTHIHATRKQTLAKAGACTHCFWRTDRRRLPVVLPHQSAVQSFKRASRCITRRSRWH